MKLAREILERSSPTTDRARFQVAFSPTQRDALTLIADGTVPPHIAIDTILAGPLLKCADGDFVGAEREILAALRHNLDLCSKDSETFISLMYALFAVQRLDLVVALLKIKFQFATGFDISLDPHAGLDGMLNWEITPSGQHRFIFGTDALLQGNARLRILQLFWELSLFARYSFFEGRESGSLVVNFHDRGFVPGLAFCDSRPDYFLIPDYIFVPTNGYEYTRRILKEKRVPWT